MKKYAFAAALIGTVATPAVADDVGVGIKANAFLLSAFSKQKRAAFSPRSTHQSTLWPREMRDASPRS